MGIFAKIVQFKIYLKAHMIGGSSYEDIKILFVLTLRISHTSDLTDLKTKKSPFISYPSIIWIMTH